MDKNNFVAENLNNFFIRELDVCALTLYGYTTEFEVKVSRADFRADLKKKTKWWYYGEALKGEFYDHAKVPNYFYYVCPVIEGKAIIQESDLKDYQGLIYIVDNEPVVVKKANRIHWHKHNYIQLLQKMLTVTSWQHYFGAQKLTILGQKAKGDPEKEEAFLATVKEINKIQNGKLNTQI